MPNSFERGPIMVRDAQGALEHVINQYEYEFMLSKTPHPIIDRNHTYQPLSVAEFMNNMLLARGYLIATNNCWTGNETFLDVGCGIGGKLRLAEALGWNVCGVERWEPYAQHAIKAGFRVAVRDAALYETYDKFDVVYMYRPMIQEDDERDLTKHIVEQMKPGAILFHAGNPSPEGLHHIGEQLWLVG
jgi:SAM-dependent methyltransferase